MMSGKDADTQEWFARLVQGGSGEDVGAPAGAPSPAKDDGITPVEMSLDVPPPERHEPLAEVLREGLETLTDDDYIIMPTYLEIKRPLTPSEAVVLLFRIKKMGDAVKWSLADAAVAVRGDWGDMYGPITEFLGISSSRAATLCSLAKAFESCRRRQELFPSHHEAVMGMDEEAQDDWLDKAVANRWSVATLRDEIKKGRASKTKTMSAQVREEDEQEQEIVFLPPHITNPSMRLRAIGEAIASTYDMIDDAHLDAARRERVQESLTSAQEALQDALDALENRGEQ